jgi:hypothetical protein
MAQVVNITEIANRFKQLGWENLSSSDVADWIKQNNVSGAELIAYLDAVIATPAACNDATITGCTTAQATKITNALKAKGVVVV